ncbi:MAG: hypothetical protein LBE18_03795 [Planctomycetaceae bacterium]|jgi:tetratricopeptide (TPR) repeat protein|nr:hypothetical protein [Planctomycetaceae bacterium]
MSNNTKQPETNTQPNTQPNSPLIEEINEIKELIKELRKDRKNNAALIRVEEAQRKFPNNLEIIALKIRIFRLMGDIKLSIELSSSIFKENPTNPVVIGEYAISNTIYGDVNNAMTLLVNYCESSNDEIPASLIEIIAELPYYLLMHGATGPVAGLVYFLKQFEAYNEQAQQIAYDTMSYAAVPLKFRTFHFNDNCPDDFPAKDEFELVKTLISQLRWNEAITVLQSLLKYSEHWSFIQKNIAALHFWIFDIDGICDSLKALTSSPQLSIEEAGEIETLRLSFNPALVDEPMPIIFAEYKITNANSALEKLSSTPYATAVRDAPDSFTKRNQVPPKGIFIILDRPIPPSNVPLTLDNIPLHIATCLLFGKETDQDARVVITDLSQDKQKTTEASLKKILGNLLITDLAKTQTIQHQIKYINLISPRFHLPPNHEYPTGFQVQLYEKYYKTEFISNFIKTPMELFGFKTIAEAAKESVYKIRIIGLLNLIEQNLINLLDETSTMEVMNTLRKTLDCPLIETIKLQETDIEKQLEFLDKIPLWQWYRIDVKNLTNELLETLLRIVYKYKESQTGAKFATEILIRPISAVAPQTRVKAYDILIAHRRTQNELEEALKLIDKAKNESVLNRYPDAMWYMHEIPIRLFLNQIHHIEDAIKHIVTKYGSNEKIMRDFYSLLSQLGLIRAEDYERNIAAAKSNTQKKENKLWTPDNNIDNTSPSNDQPKSKLWTPD